MSLTVGTRVGVYEITARIGEGGMGVVYRALDTNLKRDVAIKALPDEFANDSDRLSRFRREARVLASLNHPNISHIYGLEQSGHAFYIVMELVEGETLADRLRHRAMSSAEVLHLGQQIAEALGAAHEKDIVHRDLKPLNIKLTRDGTVKVLDFGLAKIHDRGDGGPASTATTLAPVSQSAVILGTSAYMSPEQARGDAVDKRTDIWAFGVVLYEMLAGRRPFGGDTVAETLAAVLTRDPEWERIPERFLPLLRRCLEKDRQRRLHDIADARLWLDDARPAPAAPRGGRLWPAAAALLFLIAAALTPLAIVHLREEPLPAPQTARFEIPFPQGTTPGNRAPSLSPDGRWLAYSARSADGVQRWWMRAMDSTRPGHCQELKTAVDALDGPKTAGSSTLCPGAN